MTDLNAGMNLFISGPALTPHASGFNLYLFGTATESGVQGGIPLVLEAASGNLVNANMNLFLKVDNSAITSGNLNLYISSENPVASRSLDLFIQNNPTISGLSLYIKGIGEVGNGNLADGYFPFAKGCNLFIQRNTDGGIPLYIRGQDLNNSGIIDLFIKGAFSSASGLDLSIPNTTDDINNSLNLIIQGF